jgi:hypothetical protein
LVGALLDSISAAVSTFDWAAISAAANDLAALADSETAWLQSHPPALCYEPEHGDALAAYAELRTTADAIATAANAQNEGAVNHQLAVGKQDRKALDKAASGATVGC